MKIKKLLTKSLLVAGMLAGVSNAWADDYSAVYTRAAVGDWTDDDKTDWNASSAVEVNAESGLGANANQTATYINKSFTIDANSKVKYEVDWVFGTATGRENNWNWIQFGNFLRIGVNSTYNVRVSTDAGANWNETVLGYYYNTTKTAHIEVIFNTANNTIESFSFDGTDRTALVSGTLSDKSYNSVSTGFVRGGSVGWGLANYIKTISVSQAAQTVTEADYTINYKLGDNLVKSVSSSGVVDQVITADVAVDGTEEGYVGNHYLITAAEAPSMTLIDGENVLNVPVRAPYTATLNVTRTIGGVAQTPEVTNLTETDAKVCSWNYVYPLYVQKDGVYYVADVTSSFGESGTFTDGETINKTVAYTNADYSVVYFGEPNEVTGTNTAYSNGNTGFITGGKVYSDNSVIRLGTLPAGKYKLITNVTGNAARNVVVGDCTDTSAFPVALVTITTTGEKDEEFTLATATPVSVSGKDQGSGKFNQSADVDYILVKAIELSATIPTSTYGTIASAYALDCANLPSGVTAYKVSALSASAATLEEVTTAVAAGTGLILSGDAGTYSIPVVATGTDISATNKLKAAVTATDIDANTAYILKDGQFHLVNDASTVPAGKAYLLASDIAGGARSLDFVFAGEETTAISEECIVKSEEFATAPVYNLNGQRVEKATKGLYIVNGKKVVVK